MAILVVTDFESGNFPPLTPTADVNSSISVTNVNPINGNYSARATIPQIANAWAAAWASANIMPTSKLSIEALLRIDAYAGHLYVQNLFECQYEIYVAGLGISGATPFLQIRAAGVPSAVTSTTAVPIGTPFKLRMEVTRGAGTGEIRIFLDDVEVTDLHLTGLNNVTTGYDPVITSFRVGADAYDTALTLTFDDVLATDMAIAVSPLTIDVTPISASLLVGQSQTFHANVGGGTEPIVTWYEQGNPTPLSTGRDLNLSFQASGTYTIYAVATDPTAPNSPLQSNNSIVTVTAESYTLTITAGIGGTTNPPPRTYQETSGSNMILTAIPSQGYVFDHWTTDDSNNNSGSTSITVTMNTNHNVAAVFAIIPPNQFNLIVDSSPIGGIEVTVTKN